jgi:hypothetical protein
LVEKVDVDLAELVLKRGHGICLSSSILKESMPVFENVETLPLAGDADGIIRVARTRVTLETLVGAFQDGATAEEIAQQYPSVSLADIYQIIVLSPP